MTTPINEILVSIFDAADQGQIIDPVSAPQDNEPTSDGRDNVEVTAFGGITSIIDYVISTVGGDDTTSLNGSPRNTSVNLGDGADVLNITTELLGGSISGSRFSGAAGNDTFNIIARGSGATTSTFEGGIGSDLINLTGNFSRVNVTGAAGRDTLSFGEGSNFSTSFVGMGADADRVEDNGWAMNVSASSINGGGGDDFIDFGSSTADAGAQGTLFTGGAGDDTMYGTNIGENTMLAGAGDDFVQTFTDNDDLVGGGGCDTLILGDGADSAEGGDGNDVVIAEDGQNTINGGNDDDLVLGGVGDDSILGGADAGADTLVGAGDDDTIRGGSGDDLIFGDGVDVQTSANPGPNRANDFLFTFGGQDYVANATDAADRAATKTLETRVQEAGVSAIGIAARDLVDFVANQDDNDDIQSQSQTGPNGGTWRLADGNAAVAIDTYDLARSGDCVTSNVWEELDNAADESPYLDNAWRAAEFTRLTNNDQGNNLLFGESGNDIIFGANGDDTIDGGTDDDTIIAGAGSDIMTGGQGQDVFVQGRNSSFGPDAGITRSGVNWTFNWGNGNTPDIITDFEATTNNGDFIDQIAFATRIDNTSQNDTFERVNNFTVQVRNATGSADADWGIREVVLFRGTWTGANRQFVTSNNGNDAIAFYSNLASNDATFAQANIQQAVVLTGAGDENFVAANFFAANFLA